MMRNQSKLIIEFSQLNSEMPNLIQQIAKEEHCIVHIKHAKLRLKKISRAWFQLILELCVERKKEVWQVQEFLSVARKFAKEKAKKLIKYRHAPGGFYGRLLSHVVIAERAGVAEGPVGWLIHLITSYSGTKLFEKAGKIKKTLRFKLGELEKFVDSLEVSTLVTLEFNRKDNTIELKVKGVSLFKGLPPYVVRPRGSLKSRIVGPIANEIEKQLSLKVVRKYRP